MDTLPTGTVTFLLTDIEGSTRLWQEKPQVMAISHPRHDAILRQAIEAHHGYVYQIIGDSFCAAFHNAFDGLCATLYAQLALHSEAWGESGEIRVRMGLHTGSAEISTDGSQGYTEAYTTLATTQRVMSAAHGGQVLISQTTYDLIGDHMPENVSLRNMGEHRLKDLRAPLRLYQVNAPDLPQDFPPIKSLETQPNNLPTQLTSFIGREKEIAEIKALLNSSRLVTLTGSGGTGKTRLAQEVAADVISAFPQGVWLIELATLTDPTQIIPALAQAFGLQESPYSPLASLVTDYLREKTLLLILDNCEHLIDACARLADDLLHQCAGLKILASSREALGIAGEMAYRTPSLADSESTRLFVERARAANSNYSLSDSNVSSIGKICSRLDGIPLAIELAAARTKLLSVDQIAARLDDRFKLLTGGSRTALPRQQTLRALIDWSYDMLSEDERTLLRHLSVFAGGWNFEAAEFVCPNHDVLELLAQLVNKSLVVVDKDASESTRYHLLETIRQYALDRLLDAGESLDVRNIHSQYFLQMAETAEPQLYKADSGKLISYLESERDNFRVALEWTTDKDIETALRIVYALQMLWVRHGYQVPGRILAETVIASAEALPALEGEMAIHRKFLIARALTTLTAVAMSQGDNQYVSEVSAKCEHYARAIGNKGLVARALAYDCAGRLSVGDIGGVETMSREALQAARESDDFFALGMSLGVTSEYLMTTDKDPEMARNYASQSTKVLKEHGHEWGYAIIMLGVGMVAKYKGDYELSREYLGNILPLFRAMGDVQRVNMIQSEFGHMERYEGNIDRAEQAYRETILAWQKIGHDAAVANQLECLAFIAIARDLGERADKLLGAAEALREEVNIQMSQFERIEYDKQVIKLRNGMDEEVFANLWSEGRAMSMEQAIGFALSMPTKETP